MLMISFKASKIVFSVCLSFFCERFDLRDSVLVAAFRRSYFQFKGENLLNLWIKRKKSNEKNKNK